MPFYPKFKVEFENKLYTIRHLTDAAQTVEAKKKLFY
jgi:hypothetical protein